MKVIFDTETTGTNARYDDILQLSIIDEDGNTLFNDYFHPVHRQSWPDAQRVNHISPEMVADKPTFEERKAEIQKIFNQADELIAYNAQFDMGFLRAAGIRFRRDVPVSDPMLDFAEIYGDWNEYYGNYRWQRLTTAAAYYGYEYDAHDALEDVRATLFVYNKIKSGAPEAD